MDRYDLCVGWIYCRVLSGQRRPELSIDEGVKLAADCIQMFALCSRKETLHSYWKIIIKMTFGSILSLHKRRMCFVNWSTSNSSSYFGVNYDPSNTYLAGEDPLELLKRVSHRVVTMHASDRYLKEGTIEDLRKEEGGDRLCKTLKLMEKLVKA